MSRRRFRMPRRLVAAAVGVLTAGALLGMAPATAAHAPTLRTAARDTAAASVPASGTGTATPTPTGTPGAKSHAQTVELTVSAEHAGTARRGSAMTTDAQIANGTDARIDGGTVTVWVQTAPITDRDALTSWTTGTGRPHGAATLGSTEIAPLEAGASVGARVHIPEKKLGFGDAKATGIFGIGATLTVDGASIATARSTLVLTPKGGGAGSPPTTEVAVAMPITAPATADGVISSSDLAAYTAPDGILTREVDGLLGHPDVAIGLDPMILASIRVLGTSAPASALAWRDKLLELPNDVFPLRYGDADPSVQAQAGLPKPLAAGSFVWAMQSANFRSPLDATGETPQPTPAGGTASPTPTPTDGADLPTTSELLAWPYTLSGIAWPAEGTVDPHDFGMFAAGGLTTAILSSSNVTAPAGAGAPNAAFRSGGETVLTSDDGLSAPLRAAVAATSDTGWNAAMASVNAQLTLLPAGTHTVLATLARTWPTDAVRLSATLDALNRNPHVEPITLPQLEKAHATAGMKVKKAAESSARVERVRELVQSEKQVDAFASALTEPDLLVGRQRARLLTLLGSPWLEPSNDWDRAVARALKADATTLDSISIIPSGAINVASTEVPLPVTVENKLPYAVHLVLSATPSNGRLEIDGTAAKTLQADSRGTVFVPVKATVGNGKVRLDLQLHSTTGVEIGDPASIPIEVHAEWEGVVAIVLAVLIIGLFGFGLVRNIRKHRAAKRAAGGADAAVAPGSGDDG